MRGDFDEDEFDDEADEFEFDCGMDRHGQCGYAGSEDCEFECPVMNTIRRVEQHKRRLTAPADPTGGQ